jgi:hypothetical protein
MVSNTALIEPIIIDDLVPEGYQVELLNKLTYDIPWRYQSITAQTNNSNYDVCVDANTIDSLQFVHYALLNGSSTEVLPLIRPLMHSVENHLKKRVIDVGRIKINCLTNNIKTFTSSNYNIPHTDDPSVDWLTMVYYINNSDGDTFLFNEAVGDTANGLTLHSRVSPKIGRAVIFDSRRFHAGSNPIDSQSRFVIKVTIKLENE